MSRDLLETSAAGQSDVTVSTCRQGGMAGTGECMDPRLRSLLRHRGSAQTHAALPMHPRIQSYEGVLIPTLSEQRHFFRLCPKHMCNLMHAPAKTGRGPVQLVVLASALRRFSRRPPCTKRRPPLAGRRRLGFLPPPYKLGADTSNSCDGTSSVPLDAARHSRRM